MRDDSNTEAPKPGHNQPPKDQPVRPPLLTKVEIDGMGNKQKLGKQRHMGLTFKMVQAIGGLCEHDGRGEPASFGDQLYEADALEAAAIRGEIDIDELSTGSGDKKRYRTWRMTRSEKIRCGQLSVTIREGEHLLYHLGVATSPEVAALFSVEDIVQLYPAQIIERILKAGVGLTHPFHNPVIQLQLLADLSPDTKPNITIVPAKLRMTDQGDGRAEGLKPLSELPCLKQGQEFVLDIQYENPKATQVYVFEYANDDMDKEEDPTARMVLPMPYLQPAASGVIVTNNQRGNLRAGKQIGHYGFATITLVPRIKNKKNDEPDPALLEIIGPVATAPYWTREDLQGITSRLRHHLLRGELNLAITLLDYELRPK